MFSLNYTRHDEPKLLPSSLTSFVPIVLCLVKKDVQFKTRIGGCVGEVQQSLDLSLKDCSLSLISALSCYFLVRQETLLHIVYL